MGEAAAVLEAEVDDSGREVNRGARVVKRKEKKRVHHRSIDRSPRGVSFFLPHFSLLFVVFFPSLCHVSLFFEEKSVSISHRVFFCA